MTEKDEIIYDLQKKLEKVENYNNYLNSHIDHFLKERISEYEEKSSSKRDFELVSTKNYANQCMALFEIVFDKKVSQEFWNWKYNPYGVKWRGICVIKKGKVVGHCNGMGREILYFGEYKKAIQSCDTMIETKSRGGFKQSSPFFTMLRMYGNIYVGPKKEFFMSYGFPTRRHMILSEKLNVYREVDTMSELNWEVADMDFSSEYNLEIYIPGEGIDLLIQQMWNDMASGFSDAIIGIRNADYLKYRYINHPKFKYKIFLIYSSDKKLQGLFVLKKEKNQIVLMDIVAKKENISMTILEALKITRMNNYNKMTSWITTSKVELFDCADVIIKQTEISIPTSNITLGFNPETIKNKWFLMYGDTDFA